MIKPDGVKKSLIGEILNIVEKNGFKITNIKMERFTREKAEKFYEMHRGKVFFEKLINFMLTGPVVAVRLEGENAVEKLRKIVGSTDPEKAEEGSIRRMFGTNVTVNAVHASDTPENAEREIRFFFGEEKWVD
jgi:nucleoside-diphosphate kinase